MFDIKDFYSSITEDLLIPTIHFAEKTQTCQEMIKKLYSTYKNHFFTIKAKLAFRKVVVCLMLPWVHASMYYIYVCVYMCACVYVDLHAYVYIYYIIYIYIYIMLYILYIYTHTHTYIHTHIYIYIYIYR